MGVGWFFGRRWASSRVIDPGYSLWCGCFFGGEFCDFCLGCGLNVGVMKSFSVFSIGLGRRRLLQSLLLTGGGVWTAELVAEALTLTPQMTEGPYYPDQLPLDQDNDLVSIQGVDDSAGGVVTEFGGRLLNADGRPMADHSVELWQAGVNGC